jgi:hypothetical protein
MDARLIHSGMTKCSEAVIKIKEALIFQLGGEDFLTLCISGGAKRRPLHAVVTPLLTQAMTC